MGKKKEEIEAEKKREIVRQLRKGPDLEQYVEGKSGNSPLIPVAQASIP